MLLLLLLVAAAATTTTTVHAQRTPREIENLADQGAHFVWNRKRDLPHALSDFSLISDMLGNAYLSGGCLDVEEITVEKACNSTSNALWKYNSDDDTYTALAPITYPRVRHGSVLVGDSIYIFGGRTHASPDGQETMVTKTEVHSLSRNVTTLFSNPQADVSMSDMCAFAWQGKAYYTGGYTEIYEVSAQTFSFDAVNDRWTVLPAAKLNTGRGDCYTAVVNNRVYVAGGWDASFADPLSTIEVFDGNRFTVLEAKILPGRGDAAICPILSKLYIFGGQDVDRLPRDEVQVLSTYSGVLSYAGELPTKRYRFQCAALTPSSIHIFGGQDLSSDSFSERVDEFRVVRIFEDLEARLSTPLRISGTPNAQRWMSTVASLMETRARSPVRITYRSVDSVRAQTEFMSTPALEYEPVDNLYVSDIPLSTIKYNELRNAGHVVLQIPLALNPLGFYVNLPFKGKQRVVLDACQIARIFNAKNRFEWDDFTENDLFDDVDVIPLRQGDDTSMTVTLMNWLAEECPKEFNAEQFLAVQQSPSKNPPLTTVGEITYTYASHLLRTGEVYHEAHIRNKAGNELMMQDSEVTVQSAAPVDFSADMSTVQVFRNDMAKSWPVSAVTYALVRADQTGKAQSGPLLVSFLSALFGVQDAALTNSLGLRALPAAWQDASLNAVNTKVMLAPLAIPYKLHLAADTELESPYSFAMTRRDRFDIEMTEINGQISSLSSQLVVVNGKFGIATNDETLAVATAALVFALLAFVLAVYSACKLRRINKLVQANAGAAGIAYNNEGANKSDGIMHV